MNKIKKISEIKTISEFENDGRFYGIYSVIFNGKNKIFIRNGDSIGVIAHLYNEPASKCVSEIRTDVKDEFLKLLTKQ